MCSQETPTEFIWCIRFMLYLTREREDIDPLSAYNLAMDYAKAYPTMLRVNVEEVVNEYLER